MDIKSPLDIGTIEFFHNFGIGNRTNAHLHIMLYKSTTLVMVSGTWLKQN